MVTSWRPRTLALMLGGRMHAAACSIAACRPVSDAPCCGALPCNSRFDTLTISCEIPVRRARRSTTDSRALTTRPLRFAGASRASRPPARAARNVLTAAAASTYRSNAARHHHPQLELRMPTIYYYQSLLSSSSFFLADSTGSSTADVLLGQASHQRAPWVPWTSGWIGCRKRPAWALR